MTTSTPISPEVMLDQAATAQTRAERVQHFLAHASVTLAASLDYFTTLTSLAYLTLPILGDGCAIYVLNDQQNRLQSIAVIHSDPAKQTLLRELNRHNMFDLGRDERAASAILHTGGILLHEITPEIYAFLAPDRTSRVLADQLGLRALMLLPLVARERVLGLIAVGITDPDRHYDAEDLALGEELAGRAALVIDNVRLYRDARQAEMALRQANAELEQRVAERTAALNATNERLLRELEERRRSEAARRESEERFRRAFDDAAIGMALVAVEGRWLRVNQALCVILGYTEAELLASDYESTTHPDDRAREAEMVRLLLARAIPALQIEKRYVHKQRHVVWAQLTASFVRNEAGEPLYYVSQIQDITQRKQAEEALRLFTIRLEHSNRELQDFAYVASHDLQEPLRKIRTFGDRLKARAASVLDEPSLDYLQRMQVAAQRMQNLIDDLLSFSRISSRSHTLQPVDLGVVAAEVVSDLEALVERTQGQVHIAVLPTIEADPLHMRQLFQNLIGNALKFHREDMPPIVTVRAAPLVSGSERCTIFVSDNGIGFDEKYLDRIFAVFQRLHGRDRYEGTGIGLAICRRIVERHGGSITAHSVPDRGSTFVVTLPFRRPEGPQQ